MSRDMTQIAHQLRDQLFGKRFVPSAAQAFLEEQERWRERLMGPASVMQSIQEQLSKQDDVLRQLQDTFFSPHQRGLAGLMERQHSLEHLAGSLPAASRAALEFIEHNRRLVDQVSRLTQPLDDTAARFKLDQIMPWASQLEATLERVRTFQHALPDPVDLDAAAQWDWQALEDQLDVVHLQIQQLPLAGSTKRQVREHGITLIQWVTFYMTLVAILSALLANMQAQTQIRLAQEQASEERSYRDGADREEQQFRDRLLALLEGMQERSPGLLGHYVVGTRAVRVKSAIKAGVYLDTAHPNQVVVATAKSGRWVKIRYRNHLEDREVEGWVLKHYLIRQPASADSN